MINHEELGWAFCVAHLQTQFLDGCRDCAAVAARERRRWIWRCTSISDVGREQVKMHVKRAGDPGLVDDVAIHVGG